MKLLSIVGSIGKVIGIVFLAFIVIGIILMGIMFYFVKINDSYKGDYKSILHNSNAAAPKALVVYQPTRSKDAKTVADQIAKGLNEAGYEVTLTYPGKHIPKDLSDYSLVSYGSAVYGGKLSAVLIETIDNVENHSDKTVILYSIGMAEQTPEFDLIKEKMKGKVPDYSTKFKAGSKENSQKAYEFALKAGKESRGSK